MPRFDNSFCTKKFLTINVYSLGKLEVHAMEAKFGYRHLEIMSGVYIFVSDTQKASLMLQACFDQLLAILVLIACA